MLITLAASAENMVSIYKTISIVGYSLAAVCLVLSIAIFFLYDIRGVYSFLTGKKQQKGISEMRNRQGEKRKPKPLPPSESFEIKPPQPIIPPEENKAEEKKEDTPPVSETAPLSAETPKEETVYEGETDVLSQNDIQQQEYKASEEANNTTVLIEDDNNDDDNVKNRSFILVKYEMVIHSDEIL